MSRWGFRAVLFVGVLVAVSGTSFFRPAVAACDEDNPTSPARNAQIVLSSADALDETRNELRTFVMTGSLGRVDASIVSATPRGSVVHFTATPHVSRLSPDYGEQLKGVNIVAELSSRNRPARIVVKVRQICAQYFRDTFLYQ